MKIAIVFDKNSVGTPGCYIERALRANKNFQVEHFWAKDADKIPEGFDLYFRIDHGDYKYDLPARLKPKVFWALDTNLRKSFKKIMDQAKNYDLVFCAMKNGAIHINKTGIKSFWIPFACDPQAYGPQNMEKKYDIGFVGTDGKGYRPKLLGWMRKKYPNSFISKIGFDKISNIYCSSKIGFNYAVAQRGRKSSLNMRFFEILGTKTFLLTNKINDYDVSELGFENKKHLVLYSNRWQLFKLTDYYLKNDKEREEIAQAGYEFVLNNHTYKHRVDRMLQLINENLGIKCV